jgi:hypothetical protein
MTALLRLQTCKEWPSNRSKFRSHEMSCNRISILVSAILGLLLTAYASPGSAQPIVAVHGLQVGQCVQFSDFSGVHEGTIAQAEYGGGYQVSWNGMTLPVGANSRDIQPCPARSGATAAAPARMPTNAPMPQATRITTAPAPAKTDGFKVGDCVQFSYGGGWETATIAKPEVAGAYQVNWGAIVAPASADPKYIRACPAGTMSAGMDEATKVALAKLPRGNGLGAQYGTRNPTICANRKVSITAATAKMLVQCEKEGLLGDTLYLITDAVVQVGRPRAFIYNQDSAATAIDAKQPVYDIRGSYTQYQCAPLSEKPNAFAKTHNCFKYPAAPGGYGRCYTDTSGDKRCVMTGGGPTQLKDQMPPPAS